MKGKNLGELSRDYFKAMETFKETPLGKSWGFLNETNKVLAGPLGYIGSKAGGAVDDLLGVNKVLTRQEAKTVVEETNKSVTQAQEQAEDDK